jgi:hypothetical protein
MCAQNLVLFIKRRCLCSMVLVNSVVAMLFDVQKRNHKFKKIKAVYWNWFVWLINLRFVDDRILFCFNILPPLGMCSTWWSNHWPTSWRTCAGISHCLRTLHRNFIPSVRTSPDWHLWGFSISFIINFLRLLHSLHALFPSYLFVIWQSMSSSLFSVV